MYTYRSLLRRVDLGKKNNIPKKSIKNQGEPPPRGSWWVDGSMGKGRLFVSNISWPQKRKTMAKFETYKPNHLNDKLKTNQTWLTPREATEWPLFLKVNPPQNEAVSNQNECHLGSRNLDVSHLHHFFPEGLFRNGCRTRPYWPAMNMENTSNSDLMRTYGYGSKNRLDRPAVIRTSGTRGLRKGAWSRGFQGPN